MKQIRTKTGLALSGGATRALATVGIVEKLAQDGHTFSMISGASAGSIVGAYLARHGEVGSLRKELLGWKLWQWVGFLDVSIRQRAAWLRGKVFRRWIDRLFGGVQFEDLQVPLRVSVTNLNRGTVEYVEEGSVAEAVVASCAYPGILPPVYKNGEAYVDGGVLDNLPHEVLREAGMERVVAVNLKQAQEANREPYTSRTKIVQRVMSLMMDNALKRVYEEDERLFVFDVPFEKGFSSLWNVRDVQEKYESGQAVYEARKEAFTTWWEQDVKQKGWKRRWKW